MQRPNILWIITLLTIGISTNACGPKCPDLKTAMSQAEVEYDDAMRINKLVERRKLAIKETDEGDLDNFAIKRIQFSVTAYELAINIQMRIVVAAEEGHDLYDENIEIINETRCMLDKILETDDDKFELRDTDGRDIQQQQAALERIFRREFEVQKSEFKSVLEKGVKADAPPKPETKDADEQEDEREKKDKEEDNDEDDDDEDDDDEDDDDEDDEDDDEDDEDDEDDDSLDFLR